MKRLTQLAVPVGIVLIIVMLVVPLPSVLLDLLIATNISAALLVLLTAMFVRRPLDFSSFPAVLLVLTLFRLALNVSATRLVLLDGHAGQVIDTFGHFVVGGSLVVGLIVFAILVIIQFVVITKGAERVAEVGARFTLDAMPGKQMAIDADLNSGMITEEQARIRRMEVAAEADFYGAMDGGSKFVKGDAIAAIIITIVNLVGGFGVGVAQKGMSFSDAISTYSLLSIGDGLVSQIPALLLSVATGLIVTRAAGDRDMGSDILAQLGRERLPLQVAGSAAIALCLIIPDLPKFPFFIVGAALFAIASQVPKKSEQPDSLALAAAEAEAAESERTAIKTPAQMITEAQVEPIGLELSPQIVDLVQPDANGDLLNRVKALREKIAGELGFAMPLVRTRDNVRLPPGTYAITLSGVEVARGDAPPGTVLAVGDGLENLPGTLIQEPVFGIDAKWIPRDMRAQAEVSGLTVIDRSSAITTHLADVVRRHAAELLSREDTKGLIEVVKQTNPSVIEELTPNPLSLGEVQRVLQGLLAEGVSIRNLVAIFEALSLKAGTTRDPEALTEAARLSLGAAIATPHIINGTLRVIAFEPRLEQRMLELLRPSESGAVIALDNDTSLHVINELRRYREADADAVLVCAPQVRPAVRRLVVTGGVNLPVLSYLELSPTAQITSVGTVSSHLAALPAS